MTGRTTAIGFLFLAAATCGGEEPFYFGGYGDTNRHWTGCSVEDTQRGLTNWCAYTLKARGVIGKAPASYTSTGSNTWSMIFDEHVFTTNNAGTVAWFLPMYALARHDLRVVGVVPKTRISIVDGTNKVTLNIMAAEELKRVTQRGAPNQAPEDTARQLADPHR